MTGEAKKGKGKGKNKAQKAAAGSKGPRRIVSSAHLVSDKGAELSEFEFGLIVAANAFSRWTVRCMTAAGQGDEVMNLGPLDVLVLHSVNHRERPKKLADICLVLNVEDTHLVTYALKKLAKLELIVGARQGKEKAFSVTTAGREACARYRQVREDCLMDTLAALGMDTAEIGHLAGILRALSGLYDQAARSAAVF